MSSSETTIDLTPRFAPAIEAPDDGEQLRALIDFNRVYKATIDMHASAGDSATSLDLQVFMRDSLGQVVSFMDISLWSQTLREGKVKYMKVEENWAHGRTRSATYRGDFATNNVTRIEDNAEILGSELVDTEEIEALHDLLELASPRA